jgi:hypothetical protein
MKKSKPDVSQLTDDFSFPGLEHVQAGDDFVPQVEQGNVFFNGIHREDTES